MTANEKRTEAFSRALLMTHPSRIEAVAAAANNRCEEIGAMTRNGVEQGILELGRAALDSVTETMILRETLRQVRDWSRINPLPQPLRKLIDSAIGDDL